MWAGTLSAHHVIYLTQNLELNPHSRVFAIRGGNPLLQGWDTHTVMLARLTNVVLAFAGVKDDAAYVQYPGREKAEEAMPFKTLAEFSEIAFNKAMGV